MYALTIAGGRGERLKPFTDTLPKAMVPVNERPLISYQVAWLRRHGVTDVVFLCGYLGEKIQEYFGDGSRFGVRAHYSVEHEPLGRGGAVRKGLSLVPDSEKLVIVTNGDVLTDQDLQALIQLHKVKGAAATMTLVPYPSQFGVVEVGDDQLVTAFVEKGRLPFWINAGIYVFDRDIGPLLPEKGDHETTTFPILADRRKLAALKSKAFWTTVDSSKDLREVSERLKIEPAIIPPTRS
ncbi:MAG: nucleotidyltransferase family protein [Chloroflexi bacterium]|nr:nucleotidyltransferase family protein [Chloroflexota bacterium]